MEKIASERRWFYPLLFRRFLNNCILLTSKTRKCRLYVWTKNILFLYKAPPLPPIGWSYPLTPYQYLVLVKRG